MLVGLVAVAAASSHVAPGAADSRHVSAPATMALVAPILDFDGDGHGDLANPTDGLVRGEDAYGSGAYGASRDGGRRRHAGVDYVAAPGAAVRAPVSGKIVRIGHAYNANSGLTFVEIASAAETARVFYVDADVVIGESVNAGDPIGVAQDLSERYPDGITNHVHVEIRTAQGLRIDPSALLPAAEYRLVTVGAGATGL